MAARSIGTLSISFGLVSIPVKLYSATEASRAISFNLLHKGCGSRLKQQYICVKENVSVTREDMVKGYEFAKDQYVMFSPEELKALEETGTQSAEITETKRTISRRTSSVQSPTRCLRGRCASPSVAQSAAGLHAANNTS
jgi:non-homologous end joining protein Ku